MPRTVYLLILPFALVELGSFMPVAVLVIAWALIAIEDRELQSWGFEPKP